MSIRKSSSALATLAVSASWKIASASCVATLALLGACAASSSDATTADGPVASVGAAVEGKVTFDSHCYWVDENAILGGLSVARIVAASPAFQSCVRNAINGTVAYPEGIEIGTLGPYHPCTQPGSGPPYADPPSSDTASRVISIALGSNPMSIVCQIPDSGVRNDDTILGEVSNVTDVGSTGTEQMSINGAFVEGLAGDSIAPILLHEEMHDHGYHHGEPPPGAPIDYTAELCGTTPSPGESDTDWGLRHTIPRIVDGCASLVLRRSSKVCGQDYLTSCGAHQAKLVTQYVYGGPPPKLMEWPITNECACVKDPTVVFCVPGRTCSIQAPTGI